MVVVNQALAWAALFYSIYSQQAAAVTVSALAFIAALGGHYMYVGHADMRRLLDVFGKQGGANDGYGYNGPAMPEPPSEE